MRLALMIEGQEGVSWEDWLALAQACEEHGVEAMFRSDHYLSADRPCSAPSLDAWTVLARAGGPYRGGSELGTLVSPVTFRLRRGARKRFRDGENETRTAASSLGMGRAGWRRSTRRSASRSRRCRSGLGLFREQIEAVRGLLDKIARNNSWPLSPHNWSSAAAGSPARSTPLHASRTSTTPSWRRRRSAPSAARSSRANAEREGREPISLSLMTGCAIGARRGRGARADPPPPRTKPARPTDPDDYKGPNRRLATILGTLERGRRAPPGLRPRRRRARDAAAPRPLRISRWSS